MIGTGIPNVAANAPPSAAAAHVPGASAANDVALRAAASSLADTAPASDAGPAIAAARAAAAAAAASNAVPAAEHADDSQRFLVGDPMAPHEEAARNAPVRHHTPHHEAEPRPSWMLVGIGFVGMLAIAGIGVGVAVYLGLLEF